MADSKKKESFVYIPKSGVVEIKDTKFSIISCDIYLDLNGIPNVSAKVIRKIETPKVSKKLSIDYMVSTIDTFEELANKMDPCDVLIEFEVFNMNSNDKKPTLEKILLKKWILTSVGTSQLTSTYPVEMSLIIAHPAIKLTKSLIFANYSTDAIKDKAKEITNPLDVISILEESTDEAADKMKAMPGMEEHVERLKEYIKKRPIKAEDALVWNPDYVDTYSDLPFTQEFDPAVVAEALLQSGNAAAQETGCTVWELLTSSLVPNAYLSVIPDILRDYDRLTVTPLSPWLCGKNPPKLSADRILSIQLPSSNPDECAGIVCVRTEAADTDLNAETRKVEQTDEYVVKYGVFMPDIDDDLRKGPIQFMTEPYLLSQIVAIARASTENGATAETRSGSATDVADEEEAAKTKNKALERAMEQTYYSKYASGREMSITTPFSFFIDGKFPAIPGNFVGIEGESNKQKIGGFILKVSHHIDVAGAKAFTQYTIAYCRHSDDSLNVVKNNTKNPVYDL